MSGLAQPLDRAHVLVLEDDFYLAGDLQEALEAAGATVFGPFPDHASACRALAGSRPDCAFVDLNLGGGPSFELPRELARQAIPFAFVTGYDRLIPEEFAAVERFEKPADAHRLVDVAGRLLGRG